MWDKISTTTIKQQFQDDKLEAVNCNHLDDAKRWEACELCIFTEYRTTEQLDPRTVDAHAFEHWSKAALLPHESVSNLQDDNWFVPFWLRHNSKRIGTIALSVQPASFDKQYIKIWSLYLYPEYRRQGLAGKLIEHLYQAALAQGYAGTLVDTEWVFQDAIRFYLRQGYWFKNWKRNIAFKKAPDLPLWRFECDEDDARFLVAKDQDSPFRLYFSAYKNGQDLGLDEHEKDDEPNGEYRFHIESMTTFALCLAMQGWPLVRDSKTWDKHDYYGDLGYPEGLASRIYLFEDYERKHGFDFKLLKS